VDLVGLWHGSAPTAQTVGEALRSEDAGTLVLGVEMANNLRVTLEIGPKGKKVVAVAPDWPGL
jgi:hypothetical protein